MSKFISLFALILLATFANGQSTETRKLSSFEKVFISGSLDAVLENGNDESSTTTMMKRQKPCFSLVWGLGEHVH